ncbi:hypothetical protein EW145_g1815 [Phellinidium pouzarii]|uniref:Uncharacterized protein n=1 Tax=Phellinidium pouzarii TaxID=167371 RepID=A0A4S4LF13_9AGAM|nr:hypothetical protein EW145_g1815 [Phellinidium pouzarii]
MHDGQASSPAMHSLRPSYDETPYLVRALPPSLPPPPPSSSSSMINPGVAAAAVVGREHEHPRERTLKEDIDREREREAIERREREMQHMVSSRSASASAHASPPGGSSSSFVDRVELERMRTEDMDAIRAAAAMRGQNQGQMREREVRESPHQLHTHYQHHTPSHSQSHLHPQSNASMQHQHQQHAHQHQQQSQAHPHSQQGGGSGAPPSKAIRGGVLKLAPPGVTVSNNAQPGGSADSAPGHSGGYSRVETLTLAPSTLGHQHSQHGHTPNNMGPQAMQSLPAHIQQSRMSPPSPLPLRLAPEQQQQQQQQQSYPGGQHPHSLGYQQHTQQQSGNHKSYSVMPTGPGVPPPGASIEAHASYHHQQQQQQQQFDAMSRALPAHHNMHHPHSHSMTPQPPPSSGGMQTSGSAHPYHTHPNPNAYRHLPPSLPSHSQHQHQGYPTPPMHPHYNEAPAPPIPMALQPLPPPQEDTDAEPPINLGTYVFPRTPFPYFFPSRQEAEDQHGQAQSLGNSTDEGQIAKGGRREPDASQQKDIRTHLTILIPSPHLPSSLPTDGRPRIWGGAPVRQHHALPHSSDPYAAYYNMHRQPLAPPARRMYTDDSDVVLCSAKQNEDGEVDKGLARLLQTQGGASAEKAPEGDGTEDAGWHLLESASWESGHDGSGLEVLSAEWIPHRTAHKLGLRNRSQRLREYAERRRVIMKDVLARVPGPSLSVLGKRPMRRLDLSSTPLALSTDERESFSMRTVIFGRWLDSQSVGFKYDASAIKAILFPYSSTLSSSTPMRRRKRRKYDGPNSVMNGTHPFDRDEEDADSDAASMTGSERCPGALSSLPFDRWHCSSSNTARRHDVILENEAERILLALAAYDSHAMTRENKENLGGFAVSSGDVAKKTKGRRYDLYSIPAPRFASTSASVSPSASTSSTSPSTKMTKMISTTITTADSAAMEVPHINGKGAVKAGAGKDERAEMNMNSKSDAQGEGSKNNENRIVIVNGSGSGEHKSVSRSGSDEIEDGEIEAEESVTQEVETESVVSKRAALAVSPAKLNTSGADVAATTIPAPTSPSATPPIVSATNSISTDNTNANEASNATVIIKRAPLSPPPPPPPQLLYSSISEENMQFLADGLAFSLDVAGKDKTLGEKGWFMRVQRWRWADPRDGKDLREGRDASLDTA